MPLSNAVRSTDILNQPLAPDIKAAIDALPVSTGPISVTDYLDEACGVSGFQDYGDMSFVAGLEVAVAGFNAAKMTKMGVMQAQQVVLPILVNRLRVEDLVKNHPEILDIEISRPIILTGLPRSGTTHLHNLLAADSSLRSLPYWEALEPIPTAGEWDNPQPRIDRCEESLVLLDLVSPHFRAMHEMDALYAHEEISLLALDFCTMQFEVVAGPNPIYREWYSQQDTLRSYQYLKKTLQCLQYLRGGSRWVLKSPQHLAEFKSLAAVFPDASFVVSHRDPVPVTASMATMMTYSSRGVREDRDLVAWGKYYANMVEWLLRSSVEDRDALPSSQVVDIYFDEFCADNMAQVRRVYELADQALTETSVQEMDAYIASHPRGRFGRVSYDLQADFGIDPNALSAGYEFYFQRFPQVRKE
ncbi:MAG: sulfotransferase family protein [Pseudomonadales bacterium]